MSEITPSNYESSTPLDAPLPSAIMSVHALLLLALGRVAAAALPKKSYT
jgi:hypothetical protein